MKPAKIIRFVVAAILASGGCLALLFHGNIHVTRCCFLALPVVLMRRSDFRPKLSLSRDLLIVVLFLYGFVFMDNCLSFLPNSAYDSIQHVIRHPAFVLPVWLFIHWGFFRRWQSWNKSMPNQTLDI
jgi:hypothetical protein